MAVHSPPACRTLRSPPHYNPMALPQIPSESLSTMGDTEVCRSDPPSGKDLLSGGRECIPQRASRCQLLQGLLSSEAPLPKATASQESLRQWLSYAAVQQFGHFVLLGDDCDSFLPFPSQVLIPIKQFTPQMPPQCQLPETNLQHVALTSFRATGKKNDKHPQPGNRDLPSHDDNRLLHLQLSTPLLHPFPPLDLSPTALTG